MQILLARLGESFKVPVTPEPPPSTAVQALMGRVRLGGQADAFRERAVCLVCASEQQKVALDDQNMFEALLAESMASGLEDLQEASLAALAAGPAMSATDAARFIIRCNSAKQAALARKTQAAQVHTPADEHLHSRSCGRSEGRGIRRRRSPQQHSGLRPLASRPAS